MTTTAVEGKNWYESALYEDNRRKQLEYFAWKRRLFYCVIRLTFIFLGFCCIVQNAWIYQHNRRTATVDTSSSSLRSTATEFAVTDASTANCGTGERTDGLERTSASASTGIHSGSRSTSQYGRINPCGRVSEIHQSAGNGCKGDEM